MELKAYFLVTLHILTKASAALRTAFRLSRSDHTVPALSSHKDQETSKSEEGVSKFVIFARKCSIVDAIHFYSFSIERTITRSS